MVKRNLLITHTVRTIVFLSMLASILLGLLGARTEAGSSHYFMNAFTCFLMLIITFVPSYIGVRTRIIVPAALQTMFVVFTFLAMYFGEIFNCYEIFWWWDIMLHSTSGLMLGLMGYLLLYSLNSDNTAFFHMNSFCVMLFAFCFALAAGALWEVFEFAGDALFGMNMQKSVYVTDTSELAPYINRWGRFMDPGLVDSMKDLIVDSIGALVAVIGGYLYTLHVQNGRRDFMLEFEKADKEQREALQEWYRKRVERKAKKDMRKNKKSTNLPTAQNEAAKKPEVRP